MTIGAPISLALAGLRGELERLEDVAQGVRRLTPGTDLAASGVEAIRAQRGAEANLAVVRTADELAGTLLDVVR